MITEKFINECKNRANANRLGKIIIDGVEKPITNTDNLQSFTIDSGCYVDGNVIGSVYAKCLKASFITDIVDLSEKSIRAQIGVKYADNSTEYISAGKYRVERPNNEITANMSQITAYDDLYTNLDNKYVCGIDYSKGNVTVQDLYVDVCKQLGLTPKTTSFLNDDIPIEDNPFTNNEKNRTVLQTICKISCSFVDIDVETNEIDLCWLSQSVEPDYTFYKNDYSSVDGGQVVCGPINCLIIKNSQIDSENVTKKDDEDIALNGEHSITISEDYILHNEELRQLAINNIWNRVHGMKYVDCKLTTYYGKPFLKSGSKIRVYIDDDNTQYFDTYVLKHNFTYDGSYSSVIESPALTQQEIQSKQDVSLGKALSETQIDVNKQKKRIDALVSEQTETSQKVTNLELSVNGIDATVKSQSTTITELQTNQKNLDKKIDDIEIGGRNLIILSKINDQDYRLSGDFGTTNYKFADKDYHISDKIALTVGEQITLSIQEIPTGSVSLGFFDKNDIYVDRPVALFDLKKAEYHLTVPENIEYCRVSFKKLDDNFIKLERGNKATDWTPAPEDLEQKIDNVSASFNDFKDNEYLKDKQYIQDQIDGAIQFWNGPDIPTINNYPANEWKTEADKNNHRADIYTVIEDVEGELKQGKSYRFDKVNGVWQWIELTDNELSAVQALAEKAQKAAEQAQTTADEANNRSKENSTSITKLQENDVQLKLGLDSIDQRVQTTETITSELKPTDESRGTELVLKNSAGMTLLEFEAEGNIKQEMRDDKNKFILKKSATGYGITVTHNEDETFNFSGTVSDDASDNGSGVVADFFTFEEMGVENGKKYTLSSNKTLPDGLAVRFEVYDNSTSTPKYVRDITVQIDKSNPVRTGTLNTSGGNCVRLSFQVYKGKTINIQNIGFQIEEGDKATTWQPPGAMPSPDYPSEVENVEGIENLFDYAGHLEENFNGLHSVINEDGSITTTGKPTNNYTPIIISNIPIDDILEDGQTYTISQKFATSKLYVQANVRNKATKKVTYYGLNSDTLNSKSFVVDKEQNEYTINIQTNSMAIWGDNELTITNTYQLTKTKEPKSFIPYGKGNCIALKKRGENLCQDFYIVNFIQYNDNIRAYADLKSNTEYTIIFECDTKGNRIYPNEYLFTKNAAYDIIPGKNIFHLTTKESISSINKDQYRDGWALFKNSRDNQESNITNLMIIEGNIDEATINSKEFKYESYKAEETIYINMFKENLFDSSSVSGSYISDNGAISENVNWKLSDFIEINKSICLSYEAIDDYMETRISLFDSAKNFISVISYKGTAKFHIFNIPDTTSFIRVNYVDSLPGKPLNIKNIKLFRGTNPDNYYFAGKLSDEIKDRIYYQNRHLYIDKKIGKYVCTGDESIILEQEVNYTRARFRLEGSKIVKSRTFVLSNYFKYDKTSNNSGNIFTYAIGDFQYVYLYLPSEYKTKEQYKQFLRDKYNAGTPVTVYYELETPEIVDLGEYDLSTFKDTNYIELLSNLETELYCKYVRYTEAQEIYQTKDGMIDYYNKYQTDTQILLSKNEIESHVQEVRTLADENGQALSQVQNQVQETITSTQAQFNIIDEKLAQGVTKLKNTLITIDIDGLSISSNLDKFKALMNNKAVLISSSGKEVAFFGYDDNLKKTIARIKELETEKMTAGYHRCEPFIVNGEKRTGWFYVGGLK